MRTRDLFFSFKGTIPRQLWWLAASTQIVASAMGGFLLGFGLAWGFVLSGQAAGGPTLPAPDKTSLFASVAYGHHLAGKIAWTLFTLVNVYVSLALAIKRLRDARISWTALLLIPLPFVLAPVLRMIIDPPQAAEPVVALVSLLCQGLLLILLGCVPSRSARS